SFVNLPASAATNGIGPRIQFASTEYDFGKALVGDQVRHDFTFTNTGDETLMINGVYPGCGCTTAGNWTREVPPGRTGIVPLQFNTSHFGGQSVTKTTTVVSNDKDRGSLMLLIKGTVWRPIEVNPQPAVLQIVADSTSHVAAVVKITSSLEDPITLAA